LPGVPMGVEETQTVRFQRSHWIHHPG
jgi:hypothetical protein